MSSIFLENNSMPRPLSFPDGSTGSGPREGAYAEELQDISLHAGRSLGTSMGVDSKTIKPNRMT